MAGRTYGTLRLDPAARQWAVEGLAPQVALRLKGAFPRVDRFETGSFRFPADDVHAHELLWFTGRYPLEASKLDLARLRKGSKAFLKNVADMDRILTPDFKPPEYAGLKEGCALWPYQAQAVELFSRVKGMILGDDVGLGKTNTAIGCMLEPGRLPCAVVCQAHLPEQWAERIEDFSNLKVHVVRTVAPYPLPKADVYVFSYTKLVGWPDVVATGFFRFAVFDEPQELRNGRATEKGRAAGKLCDHVAFRLGLTATPVMNYGVEMFRVMEFFAAGVLGTEDEFLREWCTDDKIVRHPDALGAYLREMHVLLRRTEDDVGAQMPKPNVTVHTVPYDEAAAAGAEDLAYQLAIKATSGSFTERGTAYRELDALARQVTGVAKARGVAAYVRILLEAGLPVLLAGWHRDVYDIWLEELGEFAPVMYTGTESKRQKRLAKEAFVSGRSPLMIISLRSGAGLDGLQHGCTDVVVGELDYSPAIIKQLIGRLRRTGQKSVVNAHYMIADGGADPVLVEVLGLKSSQQHGIVDPYVAPPTVHSDESRMKRLAQLVIDRRAAKAAAGAQAPEAEAA